VSAGAGIGDRATRVARIRAALEAALAPVALEVVDDSARHAGHAGARDGRGHFNVEVVSTAFQGMGSLARHRAVYAALGEMMATDIHALSIRALTPGEAAR
jgi:BolA protein